MAKNEEEMIKLIDHYIQNIELLKTAANNLWENLEKLDEVLTNPMGVFEDEIEEAEDDGDDWTVDTYEPFQDMEIHNLPEALNVMIDILKKKKETLKKKNKKDVIYRYLYNGNKNAPNNWDSMTYYEIHDLIREISIQSKDDFVRHMQKIAKEEQA